MYNVIIARLGTNFITHCSVSSWSTLAKSRDLLALFLISGFTYLRNVMHKT